MSHNVNKKLFIQGVTSSGKKFRPSDWAERLCCSVSCYNNSLKKKDIHCIYSPYAVPVVIGDTAFVMIDENLKEIDPKAFDFLLTFAEDNNLPILEACELPEE